MPETLTTIATELACKVNALSFDRPVSYVYNPLIYAWAPHAQYLDRYGSGKKEIILVGMNPGPWGMAQTGVPFGEIALVRDWLDIEAEVTKPKKMHPKRPIEGFDCQRSEVSGKRLWGWARDRFVKPENFFRRFFVANYCPLSFLEESGKNRTPDKLPKAEREPLFAACDNALYRTVILLRPKYIIGVGKFAAEQAKNALQGLDIKTGCITHPSPANPKANKGWSILIEKELRELGVGL